MPNNINTPQAQSIALNSEILARFKPAKIYKTAVEPSPLPPGSASQVRQHSTQPRHITSISFDDRGETLITAGEDETFRLYNCKTGKPVKTLHSKKYGVDIPRFTHKNSTIVYASTKEDDTIRYHSLHDNKYLQYFKGHKKRVVSLEVSPVDDGFMSGSVDATVRLWDLRTPHCRGLLNLPPQSSPLVAYDNSGLVFAVALNHFCRILLYDMAQFDKDPFLTIHLDDPTLGRVTFPPRIPFMTTLSFSSNGKFILVGTSTNAHYIIDSFEGLLVTKLVGHVGLERGKAGKETAPQPIKGISGDEVSWTPDSKFIVGGSQDGKVLVWDCSGLLNESGEAKGVPKGQDPPVLEPAYTLEGHPGPSRCVKFNPRWVMMASAGAELAFWLPDQVPDAEESKAEGKKKAV
ncbi:WD40-repeat-containing domain protein [Hysterangium stoloniferum]|nr:WD40-repeat-containing domain protein [Hysterangium stoloniferum]